MRKGMIGFGLLTAGLLSACAQVPKSYIPKREVCNLTLLPIEVELPSDPGLEMFDSEPSYAALLRMAFDTAAAANPKSDDRGSEGLPGREPLLFLSGGSQKGAFGAGYLDQWAVRRDGLPVFSVVTGVSVGSLLSTAAFVGEPQLAVNVAQIETESDLLDAYLDGGQLRDGFSLGAIVGLLRNGSVGDLIGLRERLDEAIDDRVLAEVAQRARNVAPGQPERKLFVAVTDFNTGRASAVDMTDLAKRYTDNPVGESHLKTCYREVLLASSIVPAAAKPVFIDGQMYIDGGVRYSIFSPPVERLITQASMLQRSYDSDPDGWVEPILHIVINGDGEPSTRCGRADPAHCVTDSMPHPAHRSAPHEDWDIVTVATRSVSLLINQVQRLSIDRARSLSDVSARDLAFARIIEEDLNDHTMKASELTGTLYDPDRTDSQTCPEWLEEDQNSAEDPVEFHPRYMHCLISYGRSVANRQFPKRKKP